MSNKETLQSYNTRLGVNNNTLDSILEQINTLPSGGSNNNVFIQEDEPENKTGLWVKTDKDIKDVNILNLILTPTWNSLTTMEKPVTYPRVVKLGEYLYIFSGRDSSGTLTTDAYKYHLPTDTFTKLANLPEAKRGAAIGIVGTDIYIFAGQTPSNFSVKSYKYDTLTDTYTAIKDYPTACSDMMFATIGTDIYLFSGTSNGNNALTNAYKYDTINDSYTTLTAFPEGRRVACAAAVGKNIYFFCGFTSSGSAITNIRSYNIDSNKYTTLSVSMPISAGHNCCAALDNNIYIFGGYAMGGTATYSTIHKYDTIANTVTAYANVPQNSIYNSGCYSDGVNIYVVGGQIPGGIRDEIGRFGGTDNGEYNADTVVISTTNGENKVTLNDTTTIVASKVYIHNVSDGSKELAEAYIGDGNKWEKIN